MLNNVPGFSVGKNTKVVGPITTTASEMFIGDDCWIGTDFCVYGNGKITIGNKVDIAPGVVLATGTHAVGKKLRRAGDGVTKPITIGDGSWIGCGAMPLAGVVVGEGCIVGAGSVLLKADGQDNVLFAGCPAEIKKHHEPLCKK